MKKRIEFFVKSSQGKCAGFLTALIVAMACSTESNFQEHHANDPRRTTASNNDALQGNGDSVGDNSAGSGDQDSTNGGTGGSGGNVGTGTGGGGGTGSGGGGSTQDLDTGTKVAEACADARAAGTMKTLVRQVNFPTPATCAWNQDGNGSIQDGRVRARREQSFSLSVPRVARFCDMSFDFPEQQMKYDDEIFLLLQGYILAASQDYQVSQKFPAGLLKNSEGFIAYKWSGTNSLYNLPYAHAMTPSYCLGSDASSPIFAQTCKIPPTETRGQMKLVIPQDKIMALSAMAGVRFDETVNPNDQWQLGFVTTGDNDSSDCQHSAFNFTVQVSYLED